jgi:Iap family predicted aminopeptidase
MDIEAYLKERGFRFERVERCENPPANVKLSSDEDDIAVWNTEEGRVFVVIRGEGIFEIYQ